MEDLSDPVTLAGIALALFLGGLLKGATGAGAPLVAVPVIAALFDTRFAVAIMVTPSLVTNIWQIMQYRREIVPGSFAWLFAAAGAAGAGAGTLLLATLPPVTLQLIMAGAVIGYVALRLARPDLKLAHNVAQYLAIPIGLASGVLQGAAGISAPISLSFLNAMRLERAAFIGTVSIFFVAMSAVQMSTLFATGLMTGTTFWLSLAALAPLLAAMPLGARLARRMDRRTFDRATVGLLSLLAVRLVWTALH